MTIRKKCSIIKINCLHTGLISCLAVLLFCLAGFPQTARAKSTISDEAGLIAGQEQLSRITDACEEIYASYDTEVIIMTRNSIPSSRKKYMEDYADSIGGGDVVMLLINMDSGNRGYEIQGYGSAEFAVDDSTIENILDNMYSDMVNGNYASAIETFVDNVDTACYRFDYADYESHPEDYTPHTNGPDYKQGIYNPLFQIVCSFAIALIIVIIMVSNSGGKMTVNQSTYLDRSDSRLLARYDHYIRTTTSKRRKPSDSGSGGGHSGGGVSSGGHSHSGGGRSF